MTPETFSVVTKQKAKVETVRINFEFAHKGIQLKRKQAELELPRNEVEAKSELLKMEKDLAVAEVEYKTSINDDEGIESKCFGYV